ncbi:hypothetical protein BDK51DRAFT_42141 [Blyttiomyces helicus]|uniref:Uncharacterized protein n=1 Tax=Blyttiomyces helicus TaxID=388810 RepID=A0A4P9WL65_9FUNG|nr:hypothetical protein BDK51DRAFT_42141 [Blyttiomyces helicus]|eukprot:RKO93769.1 hypothetical protein BDK51DRAFT_42141 [Blyttiomyces helicus]
MDFDFLTPDTGSPPPATLEDEEDDTLMLDLETQLASLDMSMPMSPVPDSPVAPASSSRTLPYGSSLFSKGFGEPDGVLGRERATASPAAEDSMWGRGFVDDFEFDGPHSRRESILLFRELETEVLTEFLAYSHLFDPDDDLGESIENESFLNSLPGSPRSASPDFDAFALISSKSPTSFRTTPVSPLAHSAHRAHRLPAAHAPATTINTPNHNPFLPGEPIPRTANSTSGLASVFASAADPSPGSDSSGEVFFGTPSSRERLAFQSLRDKMGGDTTPRVTRPGDGGVGGFRGATFANAGASTSASFSPLYRGMVAASSGKFGSTNPVAVTSSPPSPLSSSSPPASRGITAVFRFGATMLPSPSSPAATTRPRGSPGKPRTPTKGKTRGKILSVDPELEHEPNIDVTITVPDEPQLASPAPPAAATPVRPLLPTSEASPSPQRSSIPRPSPRSETPKRKAAATTSLDDTRMKFSRGITRLPPPPGGPPPVQWRGAFTGLGGGAGAVAGRFGGVPISGAPPSVAAMPVPSRIATVKAPPGGFAEIDAYPCAYKPEPEPTKPVAQPQSTMPVPSRLLAPSKLTSRLRPPGSRKVPLPGTAEVEGVRSGWAPPYCHHAFANPCICVYIADFWRIQEAFLIKH